MRPSWKGLAEEFPPPPISPGLASTAVLGDPGAPPPPTSRSTQQVGENGKKEGNPGVRGGPLHRYLQAPNLL